jgi:hypothetical protein
MKEKSVVYCWKYNPLLCGMGELVYDAGAGNTGHHEPYAFATRVVYNVKWPCCNGVQSVRTKFDQRCQFSLPQRIYVIVVQLDKVIIATIKLMNPPLSTFRNLAAKQDSVPVR